MKLKVLTGVHSPDPFRVKVIQNISLNFIMLVVNSITRSASNRCRVLDDEFESPPNTAKNSIYCCYVRCATPIVRVGAMP